MSLLATIALSMAVPPPPGGMIICYLRSSRHSPTKTEPDRYENIGDFRHLVLKFPIPASGPEVAGEQVDIHDPTALVLGRKVKRLTLADGKIAGTFHNPADDLLVFTLGAIEREKASSGEGLLVRTQKDKPPEFFTGRCGPVFSPDIEKDFEVQKSFPATRQ